MSLNLILTFLLRGFFDMTSKSLWNQRCQNRQHCGIREKLEQIPQVYLWVQHLPTSYIWLLKWLGYLDRCVEEIVLSCEVVTQSELFMRTAVFVWYFWDATFVPLWHLDLCAIICFQMKELWVDLRLINCDVLPVFSWKESWSKNRSIFWDIKQTEFSTMIAICVIILDDKNQHT